jgi:uroporphyrinogen decarboxylase
MNARDNLRSLLQGGQPAWIPFSIDVGALAGFTEPIRRQFETATGAADPAAYFQADTRTFSLPTRFGGEDPAALHGTLPPGTTFDEWGIGHWAGPTEGTLDKMFPPLAAAESPQDVQRLPLPRIDGSDDGAAVRAFHAAGYPVFGYAGSIYEWSWWLRGMQQFMLDLLSDPPLAEAVIQKVEDHTTRLATALARLGVDVLCCYDDAGTQRGMQISPELWRRFIKPAWRRVIQAVRRVAPQAAMFLHSCGKIEAIIPDIIDVGFQVLHPVQPECMDFATIYRQYGEQIVLCATISAQQIFPFGTPDEVRAEVRRLATVAGQRRRCLLMPSNAIQPETPWVNVVAFADEARAVRE